MFRISRLWLLMLGFVIICAAPSALAFAQDNFYRGKTIRLVVGLAPGGGFDTYSRVIARHIGKHISGNPTTIVDNMPGAASLLAANYVYKAAKPDGLTIGNFVGGLSFQQMLGLPGVEFDAPKFEFLGVPATDNFMIGVAKSTGITSVEQWKASGTIIKIGGVAPGGGTDDIPKVLKATLGLPLQLVSGYKGTGPVRLAFNAGEVQGACNSWESFKATWRAEMDKGEVVLLVQGKPEAPSRSSQRSLGDRSGKNRRRQKNDSHFGAGQRRAQSFLRFTTRHAERAREFVAQGLHGHDERSGVFG